MNYSRHGVVISSEGLKAWWTCLYRRAWAIMCCQERYPLSPKSLHINSPMIPPIHPSRLSFLFFHPAPSLHLYSTGHPLVMDCRDRRPGPVTHGNVS